MDSGDNIKPVNVRLSESLHRKVKAEGVRRKLTVERAYEQALEQWLEQDEEPAGSPLLKRMLTDAEVAANEKLVKKFLQFWRRPDRFNAVMGPEIRDLVAKAIGMEPPK